MCHSGTYGGYGTIYGSKFSSPILWVVEIKLGLWGLEENTFTHWAIVQLLMFAF